MNLYRVYYTYVRLLLDVDIWAESEQQAIDIFNGWLPNSKTRVVKYVELLNTTL